MVELGVCINDDIKGVPTDAPALTTQSSWDPLAYYSARQQPLCLFFRRDGNYALGNQRFQAEIERALGRRATRGKAGRRPKAQAEHHSKQLGLL